MELLGVLGVDFEEFVVELNREVTFFRGEFIIGADTLSHVLVDEKFFVADFELDDDGVVVGDSDYFVLEAPTILNIHDVVLEYLLKVLVALVLFMG